MSNRKKVLFFINGPQPTAEQLAQGKSIGAAFRNIRFVQEGESLEKADAFAGEVPAVYAKAFPDTEIISFEAEPEEAPAEEEQAAEAEAEAEAVEEEVAEAAPVVKPPRRGRK